MSNVKKVLTLVACGCICLMVATSASADYVGVKTVNKDDPDTQFLCTQANGDFVPGPLTVCNVYAIFSLGTDRLLSVGNGDLQVFHGQDPSVFFQHPFNMVVFAPTCSGIGFFPDLICDSFITIGWKCSPEPTEEDPTPDATAFDGDWNGFTFGNTGHIIGGWFNAAPPNGQGDAGQDPPNQNSQVLFLQSSVAQGDSMSGLIDVFWLDSNGNTIAEEDQNVECAAKCSPGPCDDNDPCTGPGPDGGPCPPDTECDECIDGTCTGAPVQCPDDGNECTDDFCDSDAGGCVNVNFPDGTMCNDGNDCTGPDTCTDGECGGTGCESNSDCDDGDDCTSDVCDPVSGCCTNTPLCTSDADCDDGLVCTDDVCGADGCCSNTPVDCPENNDPCTVAACEEPGGCTQVPGNEGGGCDDGVNCTENDTCSGGSCAGEDIDCPIPGQSCNENNGQCEFCQTDDQCDDGLACNGSEICNPAEGCQPGTDVDCSDLDDQCNVGVCTEPDGDCVQESAHEGEGCDDENACTNAEACASGDCVDDDDTDDVQCPEGEVCDPDTGDCVLAPSGTLDIIPGKCPNRLREHGLGFLKVALVSSDIPGEEFDACDVDIDSLRLVNDDDDCDGSVAPRMSPRPMCKDRATPFLGDLCGCHSRRKDGLDDLDMKFKLSELRDALCLNLPAGTISTLCLTGFTGDGTPIRACDCVISDRPGDGTPGPGGG